LSCFCENFEDKSEIYHSNIDTYHVYPQMSTVVQPQES